jgi:hypothetical protein
MEESGNGGWTVTRDSFRLASGACEQRVSAAPVFRKKWKGKSVMAKRRGKGARKRKGERARTGDR